MLLRAHDTGWLDFLLRTLHLLRFRVEVLFWHSKLSMQSMRSEDSNRIQRRLDASIEREHTGLEAHDGPARVASKQSRMTAGLACHLMHFFVRRVARDPAQASVP